MFVLSAGHQDGYFVTLPGWTALMVVAVAATVLLAEENPAYNMVLAWSLIGIVAIYFPGLFQRKLTMGLSIPWALLSAYGIEAILQGQERNGRNLVTVLCLIFVSASSLRWFSRDLEFIRLNVSNTTVHPVYLTADAQKIVQYLNTVPGRRVVAAWPGQPSPNMDEKGERISDSFSSPVMPDLNPILAGLTGSYTYAGHWSETPNYNERRSTLSKLLISNESIDQKRKDFANLGIQYLVAPVPEAFGGGSIPDLSPLGETLVDGSQFRLIKLAP
jgi:arabinosyltransferase C